MNSAEPTYLASLRYGLATLRGDAPAAPPAAAPPADPAAMQAWLDTVANNIALYDTLNTDDTALREAMRPGRFSGHAQMPDQIMIPFRGAAGFFIRCVAALAASGLEGIGLTLSDTGTPDGDMARLAAYCRALGFDLTVTRGTTREAIDRKYAVAAWGATPRAVIVLNSDTVPTPGFAQKLFAALAQHPQMKTVSAVSTAILDAFLHRPGFEPGTEENLLQRVWRFHQLVEARRPAEVTTCPFASMTCAAFDWAAWAEVAPGATPFDYGHHYDLHIGGLLREAGYTLGVREDCAVYHIGHATYRELGATELYDSILDRTLQYIDRWGHLPEHYDLMHELLYLSDRFHH